MSVRLSVLAILDQGACYGNQLRAEFERRTASTWPLNVGQVYTTLERLERDGLATRLQENEAGQVLYAITDEGRGEARRWLQTPVDRSAASRDEFVVKLALALTLPGADVVGLLDAQRREVQSVLDAAEAPVTSLSVRLIDESRRSQARAELAWLDHCESLLVERQTFALTTEQPRRGRPARAS